MKNARLWLAVFQLASALFVSFGILMDWITGREVAAWVAFLGWGSLSMEAIANVLDRVAAKRLPQTSA